jgi:hypothetical protein
LLLQPPSWQDDVWAGRRYPDADAQHDAGNARVGIQTDEIKGGITINMPAVTGGDDARRAEWVPADTFACMADALAGLYGAQLVQDLMGTWQATASHHPALRVLCQDCGTCHRDHSLGRQCS